MIDGLALVEDIDCDGLLIDTFHKNFGMGLLDYYSIEKVQKVIEAHHSISREAWIADSITRHEMPDL